MSKTIVIKYGGSALIDPNLVPQVVTVILDAQRSGNRIVLVHGGGPEIDRLLAQLGIEKKVLRGLRVTDDATMIAVEMALAGRTNKNLVAAIQRAGGRAIGLSGRDADLLIAEPISDDLGRVGEVKHVNTDLLETLLTAGYLPVICSVATDQSWQALNVNADSVASAVASALEADQLILMTDTDGLFADKDDPASLIRSINVSEADEMIASGRADRGMIPKLEAAIFAIQNGVGGVRMVNGSKPEALTHALSGAEIGTAVLAK